MDEREEVIKRNISNTIENYIKGQQSVSVDSNSVNITGEIENFIFENNSWSSFYNEKGESIKNIKGKVRLYECRDGKISLDLEFTVACEWTDKHHEDIYVHGISFSKK
ncbi:MAG: hypothetical protein WCU80_06085 [Paludibacteraceae bacterium]